MAENYEAAYNCLVSAVWIIALKLADPAAPAGYHAFADAIANAVTGSERYVHLTASKASDDD